MSQPFGAAYSAAYDAFYQDKDYVAECDGLERLFTSEHGAVRRVLDLGCGTGGHALPLANRGYEVVGVDRSESMVTVARRKVTSATSPRFKVGDIRALDLGERFDAAIMMFAVLGYQLSNEDAHSALAAARRHLAPEGLLLFDIWYGPAVLAQGPADRARVSRNQGEVLVRLSSGELETSMQRCRVRFDLWRVRPGGEIDVAHEEHVMRYFFPLELQLLVETAGLELVRLSAFPDIDRPANEETWSALAVTRAR